MVQQADIISSIGGARIVVAPVIVFGVRYAHGRRRRADARQRLTTMLQSFVFREDQSEPLVQQIHALLVQHLQDEPEYERLATAVASFVPGGQPPFLDETRLAAEFRHFLKMPLEDEGAWPPRPTNRA